MASLVIPRKVLDKIDMKGLSDAIKMPQRDYWDRVINDSAEAAHQLAVKFMREFFKRNRRSLPFDQLKELFCRFARRRDPALDVYAGRAFVRAVHSLHDSNLINLSINHSISGNWRKGD